MQFARIIGTWLHEMENGQKNIGRIFRNPFLEILTYTSLSVTLVTYPTIILAFAWMGYYFTDIDRVLSLIILLAGKFSWALFEYFAHRYIFHWASESELAKRITYILHGIHHEFPRAEERVFMPPLPGILISASVFVVFRLVMGGWAFPFMAGFMLGYLIYCSIHYMMHKTRVPKFLRRLWIHHNLHHYRYHDKAFGVSNLLWDRVFGTMPP